MNLRFGSLLMRRYSRLFGSCSAYWSGNVTSSSHPSSMLGERRFSSLCNLQSRQGLNLWQEMMLSFLRVSGKPPGIDTSSGHSCMNNSVRELRLCRRLGMALIILQSKITNDLKFGVAKGNPPSGKDTIFGHRLISKITSDIWSFVIEMESRFAQSLTAKVLSFGNWSSDKHLRESQLLSKNK